MGKLSTRTVGLVHSLMSGHDGDVVGCVSGQRTTQIYTGVRDEWQAEALLLRVTSRA